eukprot:712083-Pelagomonas_calceolata.AAC.1
MPVQFRRHVSEIEIHFKDINHSMRLLRIILCGGRLAASVLTVNRIQKKAFAQMCSWSAAHPFSVKLPPVLLPLLTEALGFRPALPT